MKSAPTIAFDYRPSRALVGASVGIVLLAIVAILASGLAWPLRVGLASIALLGSAVALWRFLHPALRRVAHGESGWLLCIDGDREEAVVLCGHAQAGPLQALDFSRANNRRLRIVLTPDNADAATRRRLRLILARTDISPAR